MNRCRLLPISALFCLIQACGILEPPQDPDQILRERSLLPQTLATQEHFASAPDSGAGTLTHLRYSLTASQRQAIQTGAVLEAVLSVPTGQVVVEGWVENAAGWELLLDRYVDVPRAPNLWWRGGWTDPTSASTLLGSDGFVRLNVTPGSDSQGSILRVIELAPGLGVYDAPSDEMSATGALALSGEGIAILEPGAIRLWSTQGVEQERLIATNSPHSFCRIGDSFYGTSPTEIRRVPATGGTWQRVAALPWPSHGGVALATDLNDLYLIRYPTAGQSSALPTLFILSEAILNNTYDFLSAVKDSMSLRRNGMVGGNAAGFAWWGDERLLAAPGTQEGAFGLVTFSRAGWFQDFIPLPFMQDGIKFAFAGDHLFVGGARPTLEALAWGHTYQPDQPRNDFIYRFTVR